MEGVVFELSTAAVWAVSVLADVVWLLPQEASVKQMTAEKMILKEGIFIIWMFWCVNVKSIVWAACSKANVMPAAGNNKITTTTFVVSCFVSFRHVNAPSVHIHGFWMQGDKKIMFNFGGAKTATAFSRKIYWTTGYDNMHNTDEIIHTVNSMYSKAETNMLLQNCFLPNLSFFCILKFEN